MRPGCMTEVETTSPSMSITATDIGWLNVSVWTERASSNTGEPLAP